MVVEYVNEIELRKELLNIQQSIYLEKLYSEYEHNKKEIDIIESNGIIRNYPKDRFGEMVLLIATKLMTKSNFSGYSDNWKHDMLSYAITRVLTYCINSFENDRISIRTGNVTKAFSYITDTIKNAFIEVIKDRKEEQDFINNSIISFDSNSLLNKVYDSVELDFKYEQLIVIFDEDYKERLIEKIIKINPSEELIFVNVNEETKQYLETIIQDKIVNTKTVVYKDTTDINILNILQDVNIFEKVMVLYDIDIIISLEEYDNINALNIPTLNITKFRNIYKPKMTFKGRPKNKPIIIEKMEVEEEWK